MAGVALSGCDGGRAASEPLGDASDPWKSGEKGLTFVDPYLSDHGKPHLLSPVVTPILWSSVDPTNWVDFYTATATSHSSRLAEYGFGSITVNPQVAVDVASRQAKYDFSKDDKNCLAGQGLTTINCKIEHYLDTILASSPPTKSSYYPVQLGLDANPVTPESCGGYHQQYASSACGAGAIADGDFATSASWAAWESTIIDTTNQEAVFCQGATGPCGGSLTQDFVVPSCDAPGLMFEAQITTSGTDSSAATLRAIVNTTSPWWHKYVELDIDAGKAIAGGGASGWLRYTLPLYTDSLSLEGQPVQLQLSGVIASGTGQIEVRNVTTGSMATYGVMYACCLGSPPDPSKPSLGFDQIVASHEILEAATDPFGGGYFDPHGEIADLCFLAGPSAVTAGGVSYVVASSWSNAANGCVRDANWTMPAPQLTSGSFEPSTLPSPWTLTGSTAQMPTDGAYAHGGVGYVMLGSSGATDVLTSPSFVVPSDPHRAPGFWFYTETLPGGSGSSSLTVNMHRVKANKDVTLATFGSTDDVSGYVGYWVDLGNYGGDTVQVSFTAVNDVGSSTQYVIDDVSLL
jgi:hypothetical protein